MVTASPAPTANVTPTSIRELERWMQQRGVTVPHSLEYLSPPLIHILAQGVSELPASKD